MDIALAGNTSPSLFSFFIAWVYRQIRRLISHNLSLFLNCLAKPHAFGPAPLVALALLSCQGTPMLCQYQPSPSVKVLPTTSAPVRNPPLAETQLRLDVDRDPVHSPDNETTSPENESLPLTPAGPGEIQKVPDGSYTMHKDVDEVLLTCAVVDDDGQPIQDLKRGDFRVWEDGISQTVSSFLHMDQPVSLGILVDNSGSMREKHPAVKEATLDLLRASNSQDAAFIVNFSDRAILDQGFTSNIAELNRGLAHFDSRGTTALYDAVAASADELANHGKLAKQVLLVITDGADNASRLDLEQTIRRVQNLGGPVVYSIGLLFETGKEESARARNALEKLSQETGGVAYFANSLQDVDGIATAVARDIRTQYTIGYHSAKPVSLGGYRVVHVEATAPKHGKLIVRTRRGYYAQLPATLPHGTQTAQSGSR